MESLLLTAVDKNCKTWRSKVQILAPWSTILIYTWIHTICHLNRPFMNCEEKHFILRLAFARRSTVLSSSIDTIYPYHQEAYKYTMHVTTVTVDVSWWSSPDRSNTRYDSSTFILASYPSVQMSSNPLLLLADKSPGDHVAERSLLLEYDVGWQTASKNCFVVHTWISSSWSYPTHSFCFTQHDVASDSCHHVAIHEPGMWERDKNTSYYYQ